MMRFVAILLLILSSIASMRASLDRVHTDYAVRAIPHRFLLLTIAGPGKSTPAYPARREQDLESALDEEEATDLDPVGPPPQRVVGHPLARPGPEAGAVPLPHPPSTRQGRPVLLRC